MPQRTRVVGRRSIVIWLLIIVAVLAIIALAVGGLVVYPRLQEQRAEQARLAQAEQHYQAGIAFQKVEDWEAAEAEFKQVISLDANYRDAQSRLAEAREKGLARVATVTAIAEATVLAAPTATAEALETHYQKGLGHINLGQWTKAQSELQAVFDTDPNYKDIQQQLADVNSEVAKLTPTATSTPSITSTPEDTSTPTVIPTSTPYPTRTPSPNYTATQTRTPTPTRTLTPTRVPTRTPTRTLTPTWTPTKTSTLTITPTSTPTSVPTTVPGTILSEGETWYQNGLALTAKDFCVVHCLPDRLKVTFVLESRLEHEILLPEIDGGDFILEFDTGVVYGPYRAGLSIIPRVKESRPLPAGSEFKWAWDFNWWKHKAKVGARERRFVLTVEQIGERITDAKWQGEILR